MEKTPADGHNFGHSFYSPYIQEDENMRATVKAILNQIHENRVAIKELHVEFGSKFCQIINSYRNRLEENATYYDDKMKDLMSKHEQLIQMSRKTIDMS